ncbi:MAG: glycosyltransferase [Alicyclobacillus sp.]|nr:glycosyltransferase [Alicyclobacillus sp.]
MSKERVSVVLFIPTLVGGGAERVAVNLVNHLDRTWLSPSILLLRREGPFLQEVRSDVTVDSLEIARMRNAVPGLWGYIRHKQPDVVVTHMTDANIIGAVVRKLSGSRTKLMLVEHSVWSFSASQLARPKRLVMQALIPRVYPGANRIVCVSDGVASDLRANFPNIASKLEVIHNPVLDERIWSKMVQHVEHPWFEQKEAPIIVAVGRLIEAKDHRTLLRALSVLNRERNQRELPEARLLILGEGPLRKQLEEFAVGLGVRAQTDFIGFQSNPYKYMYHSDAFVLSSKWEGLPTVLIEALATGVPVVSTDCPSGPREILRDGELGRLVQVGDADELAQAIQEVFDKKDALRAGREMRISRAKDFRIRKACFEYERLLREVVS